MMRLIIWFLAALIGFFTALTAYMLSGIQKLTPSRFIVGGKVKFGNIFHDLSAKSRLAKIFGHNSLSAYQKTELLTQLPIMLDILTLGLSAGLSFDASLSLYCKRYKNALSNLVQEACYSWQIGLMSRSFALKDLSSRLGIKAFDRFVDTVCQALNFGSPLSEVLIHQSRVIRDEQRSDLEEQMEKLPVKLLIPLGTLIVPAMLLAILGPLLGSSLTLA